MPVELGVGIHWPLLHLSSTSSVRKIAIILWWLHYVSCKYTVKSVWCLKQPNYAISSTDRLNCCCTCQFCKDTCSLVFHVCLNIFRQICYVFIFFFLLKYLWGIFFFCYMKRTATCSPCISVKIICCNICMCHICFNIIFNIFTFSTVV